MTEKELYDRASKIKMIALDNDGVMTDGVVYISDAGIESKGFSILDGFGIVMARRAGLLFSIITGVKSNIIENRAFKLHIDEVHQSFTEKDIVLGGILSKYNLKNSEVAYMGDDLFDLPALKMAGLSAAPADAHPDVRARVDWVSTRNGGHGAVRQMIEIIIKARGQWDEMMSIYAKS